MMFWLDKPISDKQTARDISHQHAAFCSEFLWTTGLDHQTADIMTSISGISGGIKFKGR